MSTQKPVVRIMEEHEEHEEREESHPAYAMIGASRWTGGKSVFHGSDFRHSSGISVTICRAVQVRSLSRDWHHAREELIRVDMSESQWAAFISTLNVGDGVPCTLRRIQGEQMPLIPLPEDRKETFGADKLSTDEGLAAGPVEARRIAYAVVRELVSCLAYLDSIETRGQQAAYSAQNRAFAQAGG